jgi:hypothetical protein
MRPPGVAAFEARPNKRSGAYSYERRAQQLDAAFERRLRANREAWRFYESQPPWYRRTSSHWVMSVKQQATRERRFAVLLTCSAEGRPIPRWSDPVSSTPSNSSLGGPVVIRSRRVRDRVGRSVALAPTHARGNSRRFR